MSRYFIPLVSCLAVLKSLLCLNPVLAQSQNASDWTVLASNEVQAITNVAYLTVDGQELKLDFYLPKNAGTPLPVLVYYHGGGWVAGNKEFGFLFALPYLEMGFAVANVGYRLASTALAPAAVEDSRCALRWVYQNAEKYKLDTNRIVTSGHSAGGHLALMAGMAAPSAGLDYLCSEEENLRVAAIINYFGVADVADVVTGVNEREWALTWLGEQAKDLEIVKRVSPLTYVRSGLPPVLTIHGDQDPVVPYEHSVRLHEELQRANVPNELITVSEGKHGFFNHEETLKAHQAIQQFLIKHNVWQPAGN